MLQDEESETTTICKDDCNADSPRPHRKKDFAVSGTWAAQRDAAWVILSTVILVHTIVIAVYHNVAEDSIILYVFVCILIALQRSVDTMYFTAYEYQLIIWVAWVVAGYATRNIHEYLPYTVIVCTNVVLVACVVLAHVPSVHKSESRSAAVIIVFIIVFFVPHYDANIVHSSAIISGIRVFVYLATFYAMVKMNVLDISMYGFYRAYYAPVYSDMMQSRLSDSSKIIFPLYLPQWVATIGTMWILLCDPWVLPLAAVQLWCVYYMKLGSTAAVRRVFYSCPAIARPLYHIGYDAVISSSVNVSCIWYTGVKTMRVTPSAPDAKDQKVPNGVDVGPDGVKQWLIERGYIIEQTSGRVTMDTINEDRRATVYINNISESASRLKKFTKTT